MKPLRLKTYGDAMGTTIDVEVYFTKVGDQGLLDRLIQVAAILRDDAVAAKSAGDLPLAVARLVTRIETNFAAGHIVVSACATEEIGAELIQRSLLDLVPNAEIQTK